MTPARLESIDLHRRKTLRIAAVAGLIPLGLLGGPQGLCLAQAETAGSPQPRVRVRWGVDGNHDGDGAGERGSDTPSLALSDTVIVRLEVWVSTWFLAPIDFPATLATDTALSEQVGGSPQSAFEELADQRWTGLIHRYRVQPLQPGEVTLDLAAPLEILPGRGEGQPQQVRPPEPLRLAVRVPTGAEGLQPFVAARRLELHQQWQPDITPEARWQVGDAIRRDIELNTDSSSPLLPAPNFGSPAGVEPRVHASTRKPQQAGTQPLAQTSANPPPSLSIQHSATYVLQTAGTVELPAIEIGWWDIEQARVRVSRLPGLTLKVESAAARPDPFSSETALSTVPATEAGKPSPPLSPFSSTPSASAWSWGIASMLGLALASWGWRRRKAAREAALYRLQQWGIDELRARWHLRRACLRDDPAAAQHALAIWLWQLPAARREAIHADKACTAAIDALERYLHGPPASFTASGWTGRGLWQALRQALQDSPTSRARKRNRHTQLPRLSP